MQGSRPEDHSRTFERSETFLQQASVLYECSCDRFAVLLAVGGKHNSAIKNSVFKLPDVGKELYALLSDSA